MNLGSDFATQQVVGHHETISWCTNIMKDCQYACYRPATELLQSRNAYLHDVMNYRSHQQEY